MEQSLARRDMGDVLSVHLTDGERSYIELVSRAASGLPMRARERALTSAGEALGLSPGQRGFVRLWVETHGDVVLMSEDGDLTPRQCLRYLSSPLVFRLLEGASRLLPNMPSPVMTKDEMVLTWTMVSRDPGVPENVQGEARKELSKLLGYYQGVQSDGVNVGVQVVLKGGLDGQDC
jgi:hypothetical protein